MMRACVIAFTSIMTITLGLLVVATAKTLRETSEDIGSVEFICGCVLMIMVGCSFLAFAIALVNSILS